MANQKYKSDAVHCTEEESSWKNIHSLLDTQAEHIEVGLLLKATFMEVFIPLILQLTKIKIKTVAAKLLNYSILLHSS